MKNIQITIDEETLARVDLASGPLRLNRSEIVRRALRDWLRRQAIDAFEREWIAALGRKPDEASRADAWSGAQTWSDS